MTPEQSQLDAVNLKNVVTKHGPRQIHVQARYGHVNEAFDVVFHRRKGPDKFNPPHSAARPTKALRYSTTAAPKSMEEVFHRPRTPMLDRELLQRNEHLSTSCDSQEAYEIANCRYIDTRFCCCLVGTHAIFLAGGNSARRLCRG